MTAGMGVLSVAVTTLVLATEEHHHTDEDAPIVRKRHFFSLSLSFVGVLRSARLSSHSSSRSSNYFLVVKRRCENIVVFLFWFFGLRPIYSGAGLQTFRQFFSFFFIFLPRLSSCGACLNCYREKGLAIPFPRRPSREGIFLC